MKQNKARFTTVLIYMAVIAILLFTAGCAASTAPAPSPSAPASIPSPTPAPGTAPIPVTAKAVTINLVTQSMAFNTKVITVPAGAEVTVNFENKDNIGHNLAIYNDKSAAKSIFVGEVISGKSVVYKFTAPSTPGTYFFRCDPHAAIMNGDFVVTAAGP